MLKTTHQKLPQAISLSGYFRNISLTVRQPMKRKRLTIIRGEYFLKKDIRNSLLFSE
jgi:hypothetical protein